MITRHVFAYGPPTCYSAGESLCIAFKELIKKELLVL